MAQHKSLVESQASIAQFEETQRLRELIENQFQETQNEFIRSRWPAVCEWLSPYNSILEQLDCIKAKEDCPGSGQWLLGSEQFKNWQDPIYCLTPLLWLNGIPGAGEWSDVRMAVFGNG